jgi:hypothetical protein
MARIDKPWYWTRVGGVAGIVFFVSLAVRIALMPLSHSVSEPAFDASSSAFLTYGKSEADLPFALELVGVVGLFAFVAFAGVLSDRFRLEQERSNAPSILVLLASAVLTVLWLSDLAIVFAEKFRHGDLDTISASVFYGLSNGVFVLSWAADGAFLVAAGIASLWSRAFPSWLAWAALVIGIGMFLAVAAPLTVLWYLPYFLSFFWVLVASVVLLTSKPRT